MMGAIGIRRVGALASIACAFTFLAGCNGSGGDSADKLVSPTFAPERALNALEVDRIIQRAAESIDAPNMSVAVVDRMGRVLGLWTRNPATSVNDLNTTVSIARTGAFMSSSQGPITTRTLEFISTFHFPATFGGLTRNPIPNNPFTLDATLASQRTTTGVAGTPQGPLWLIFTSNRGAPVADPHLTQDGIATNPPTTFNVGQDVPLPRRIDANGNEVFNTPGPGLSYLAGGIPIYKDGLGAAGAFTFDVRQVGGVGVYITDALGVPQPQAAEFAAIAGLVGTDPFGQPLEGIVDTPATVANRNFFFPVPAQGAIFLVGVLLPEHEQVTLPAGFGPGTAMGPANGVGLTITASQAGGPLPFGYIIGPRADPLGNLTQAQVDQIIQNAVATANGTRAAIRLLPPFLDAEAALGSNSKYWISVTNLEGLVLAVFRMEDAPIFSYDVSLAKARNVTYFSSAPGGVPGIDPTDVAVLNAAGIPTGIAGSAGANGVALTNRTLAFNTQPFHPPGIDSSGFFPGPLFAFAAQNAQPAQYNRMANAPIRPGLQNGIIFFPGAAPLYVNGQLVGGVGVSGDGVEQDDFVTAGSVVGFEPPAAIKVDNFSFNGIRHPYFKFPQIPGPGNQN